MKRTGRLIIEGMVLFNVQGWIKRIIYTVYDGLSMYLIADTVRQSVKSGTNTGDSGAHNPWASEFPFRTRHHGERGLSSSCILHSSRG